MKEALHAMYHMDKIQLLDLGTDMQHPATRSN